MKCIVCYSKSDVIWEGNSLCLKHFKTLWKYLIGDESGKTITKMKEKANHEHIQVFDKTKEFEKCLEKEGEGEVTR